MAKQQRLTIPLWVQSAIDHLKSMEQVDGRVGHICSMENGFEDWLKFEMAALLRRSPWNYERWIGDEPGDVGLEYCAELRGVPPKRIDLWASPFLSQPNDVARSWNFLELKVAFDNYNAAKQFAAWRADFDALRRIDCRHKEQRVEQIGALIVAPGFSEESFAKASTRARNGLKAELKSFKMRAGKQTLRLHLLIE